MLIQAAFISSEVQREMATSGKHVHAIHTPAYTSLLYSKTGGWRVNLFFLIFTPKHRLWVLVRTASLRWLRGGSDVYAQPMF